MAWCETLRKWVIWMLRWLGYFWPWIVKVKLYLGNGRPECHGTKVTGSIGCPEVKHESTGRCADWGTFDLCLWPCILKVKLYLGNGRPDRHGMKEMGVNKMPWCKRQPLCDLEAEETVRDWGWLKMSAFPSTYSSFSRVYCDNGRTINLGTRCVQWACSGLSFLIHATSAIINCKYLAQQYFTVWWDHA